MRRKICTIGNNRGVSPPPRSDWGRGCEEGRFGKGHGGGCLAASWQDSLCVWPQRADGEPRAAAGGRLYGSGHVKHTCCTLLRQALGICLCRFGH